MRKRSRRLMDKGARLVERGVELKAAASRALNTRDAGMESGGEVEARRLLQERAKVKVGRCRLTQVDHRFILACFQRFKVKCDQLLSNVAFNCSLRHYVQGWWRSEQPPVGRCRLTPGLPQVDPMLTPG